MQRDKSRLLFILIKAAAPIVTGHRGASCCLHAYRTFRCLIDAEEAGNDDTKSVLSSRVSSSFSLSFFYFALFYCVSEGTKKFAKFR